MHLGFDDEMLCAIARKSQMMGTLLVCTDCFEEEPTAAAAPAMVLHRIFRWGQRTRITTTGRKTE